MTCKESRRDRPQRKRQKKRGKLKKSVNGDSNEHETRYLVSFFCVLPSFVACSTQTKPRREIFKARDVAGCCAKQ